MNLARFSMDAGGLPLFSTRLVFGLTFLWLTAAITAWLLRRSSAAVRHRAWGLSVVAALLLPAPLLSLPEFRLGWIDAPAAQPAQAPAQTFASREHPAHDTTASESVQQPIPARAVEFETGGKSPHVPDVVSIRPKAPSPERNIHAQSVAVAGEQLSAGNTGNAVRNLSLLLLLAPMLWGLARIGFALAVSRRIVIQSTEICDRDCRAVLRIIAERLEWRGAVKLLQSAHTSVPLCVGWKNACIILPEDWRTWSAETLRAALAHELSHVIRRDVAWQLLARLACAVYWFHPLAWLAAWRMRIERETACDDGALCAGERPTAYARALVAVAERVNAQPAGVSAAVAMATHSHLEQRVRGILAANRSRLPVRRKVGRTLAGATLIVAVLAAVLSPFSSDPVIARGLAQASEAGAPSQEDKGKPAEQKPAKAEESLGPISDPGIVTGEVRAEDGSPVAGALVLLREKQLFRATTDDQGHFRFEKIPPGQYRIWSHKENLASPKERLVGQPSSGSDGHRYLPAESGAGAAGQAAEGGRFPHIRLTMKPGKRVRFTVISAVTNEPLEGADIRFGFPDRRQKKTDKEGKAVEGALLPEKYDIGVEAAGHASERRELDLSDSDHVTLLSFTLPAGGVVRGVATDESGKPLIKAGVSYRTPDVSYGYYGTSPYTDAEGKYQNLHLPLNAPIEVSASLEDYVPQRTTLTLSDRQPERQFDIQLKRRPRGGSITGIVTDSSGKAIVGARVTNGELYESKKNRETTTDAEGRFVLHDLISGLADCEIVVRARKYGTLMQKVETGTEEAPAKVVVRLQPGHTIRGRVMNPAGEPIKGAYVSANGFGTQTGETVYSNDDGVFEFDSLPEGSKFMFQATGYTIIFDMPLALDQKELVVVTLEPVVALEGRVLDAETKKPIEDFLVRGGFSRNRFPGDANGSYPNTLSSGIKIQSRDGTFKINEMTKGVPLEITFEAKGYERESFARIVAGTPEANDVKEVLLKKSGVVQPATLAGKFVDHQTKAAAGVQVRLIVTSQPVNDDQDDTRNRISWGLVESGEIGKGNHVEQFFSTVSDADGKFEVKDILPGKFLQIYYWSSNFPKVRTQALAKTEPGAGQSTIIRIPEPAALRGFLDRDAFPKVREIQLEREDNTILVYHAEIKDGQTEFQFENLPPGPFRVSVCPPLERLKVNPNAFRGGMLAQKKLTVEPGKTYDVRFNAGDLIKKP